jgi:hypothetical protein
MVVEPLICARLRDRPRSWSVSNTERIVPAEDAGGLVIGVVCLV